MLFYNNEKLAVIIFTTCFLVGCVRETFGNECDLYDKYQETFVAGKDNRKEIVKLKKLLHVSNDNRVFSNIHSYDDIKKEFAKTSKVSASLGTIIFFDDVDSMLSGVLNHAMQDMKVKNYIKDKYAYLHINFKEYYQKNNLIELLRSMRMTSPPMVVYFDKNGKEIDRVYKCVTPNKFIDWLIMNEKQQ